MSQVLQPFKWFYHEFGIASIHKTGRNAYLIILARSCRMFAYGTNSLILAIFFSALGYSDHQIGIFMTLTLLGDVFLGTFLTLIADRVGRRKVLLGGSMLMVLSGLIFAVFENFWILLLAAILGVISVTGGDFGPFRSIEESVLSQLTDPSTRSDVLSWYVTISAIGSSIGSETSGRIIHYLEGREGWTSVNAYHALFWIYTAMGVVNALFVLTLSDACELSGGRTYSEVPQHEAEDASDLHGPESGRSAAESSQPRKGRISSWFSGTLTRISPPTRAVMYKLWFLLSVDSLADGMVPYSLTNYYVDTKFHPSKATLGDVTSASQLLTAVGAVFAAPLARHIGLINTMVFTHVPSSAAVLVFPFPSQFWMTAALLLIRAGLNNMDQAPRSAFIAAVVEPDERTAVMGITSMIRTFAAMMGPSLTGVLAASERFWIAFVVAGLCRLAYDFGLYAMFVHMDVQGMEQKRENEPNGHIERPETDEESGLEMQSLPHDKTDGFEVVDERTQVAPRSSALPTPGERSRSRSPHNWLGVDT